MKKAPKYFAAVTMALFTLASCSNDEPNAGWKDCPDFMATIGGVESRAYDNNWENGDEIGVSDNKYYTNVRHRTNAVNGSFTVVTPSEQIYFQDENEVTFTAYYPWNQQAASAETITADTKLQPQQKTFDFLWAQATGKKASSTVTFNFAHKMAKVVLTVQPGNGVSFDEVKNTVLSIVGFKHNGAFNHKTGTATATGNVDGEAWKFTEAEHKAPAVVKEVEEQLIYSLILFPQDLSAKLQFTASIPGNNTLKAEIDLTDANSDIDGAQAKNNLVAGRQYNLTVTLHKTAASLDQCAIQPWVQVSDNIDVD